MPSARAVASGRGPGQGLPVCLVLALVIMLAALVGCGRSTDSVTMPSPTFSEKAPGISVISWSEASTRVGERHAVEGPVVDVTRGGGDVQLNVGVSGSAPDRFVIVIPASLLKRLPGPPEEEYGGHLVRATGRIVQRGGVPAIVVQTLKQLTVVQ